MSDTVTDGLDVRLSDVRVLDGANSHCFDKRIVIGDGDGIERGDGGECIAFADEPYASLIAHAIQRVATERERIARLIETGPFNMSDLTREALVKAVREG